MNSAIRGAGLLLFVAILALACDRTPTPPPVEPPPPPAEPPPPVTEPHLAMHRVSPSVLPQLLDGGDYESLRLALKRHRSWLRGRPASRTYTYGDRTLTADDLRGVFQRFEELLADDPPPEVLAERVAESFDIYASVGKPGTTGKLGNAGEMLVTGYYEPTFRGSLRRTKEFNVPIYRHPGDIFSIDLSKFSDKYEGVKIRGLRRGNELLPYPDRREIRESNRLRGREIAWAADVVDVFFLEVQGSGVMILPNGKEVRLGYAGGNGRQYRSIGRLLIDRGALEREKVSMQSIRRYLAENPDEVEEILDYNESFVFFRKLNGPAVGSHGVPVTGERSLATDYRLFPKGALCFMDTDMPAMAADGTTAVVGRLGRFMIIQDTGGAIRGTHRADFFWGRGELAAERAGVMKQPGRLYFLLPKSRQAP